MKCNIYGCENKKLAKGLCSKHYWRLKNKGTTEDPPRSREIELRFWDKVEKTDGCWLWVGQIEPGGYGRFRFPGGTLSHRYSFMIHNGYLPGSHRHVMHTCDNRKCVNPYHLRDGSREDNVKDMVEKKRHPGTLGRYGEKSSLAKISNDLAKKIYTEKDTYKNVSKKYCVPIHVVADIKTGRKWSKVTYGLKRGYNEH